MSSTRPPERRSRLTRTLARAFACALTPAVALGACSDPAGPLDARRALERSERAWHDQGITSYTYLVEHTCFCVPEVTRPMHVTVQGGTVTAATYGDTGEPVPAEVARVAPTVDQLFQVIGDAITRNAYRVRATYDPALSYPTSIDIDYDARTADDEQSYTASGLAPATP
jgi:hypothetical protein